MATAIPTTTTTKYSNVPAVASEATLLDDELSIMSIIGRTFKSATVAIMVWAWGHYGFSIAWIFVGMFWYVMHHEFRKLKVAKKAYAQHALLDERRAVESRIFENLSWVYFPDVEKAEWLNKIIKQMWPFIGDYAKDLMLTTIEPSVREALLQYNFKNFKFEKIDIGDVPLRVDGLKLYSEGMRKGEVMFDMEISYVSDSNIKVTVQGVTAGIKALTVHGNLRVVLKPLINDIPIVGGVTVFFLNKPTIKFDLTSAANLLDMPLLDKSLRSVVEDIIAFYLVLPNRFPISLSAEVTERTLADMKYPLPQGVIALHVLEAAELKAADTNVLGKATSDPYCVVQVGARTMKTKTISSNLNPVWNEFFEVIVDQKHGQFIVIDVFDKDTAMEDDTLGRATIDIELMAKSGTIDVWMPLENVKTGKIHLQATWLFLSRSLADGYVKDKHSQATLRGGVESVVRYSAAVLIVTVERATKLPVGEKSRTERNAFAKLALGKTTGKTTVKMLTCEPQWDENFQFLVEDPDKQSLTLELYHKGSNDKKMATLNIPLGTISPADDPRSRLYDLPECGPRAKISLRLCLRLLTTQYVKDTMDFFSTGPSDEVVQSSVDGGAMGDVGHTEGPLQSARAPSTSTSPGPISPPWGGIDRSILEGRSTGESRFGKIRLTIRYSTQRGQLVVVIHECQNLIPCDKDNLADPYVRVYVLPDSTKATRKRTKMIKNNLSPVFDETFEWTMTLADASSRTLDIAVKNDVTLFSKSRTEMGEVRVDLSNIGDLQQTTTAWFDLQESGKN